MRTHSWRGLPQTRSGSKHSKGPGTPAQRGTEVRAAGRQLFDSRTIGINA